MTTIVTRTGKGAPLSWIEADANFTNLNTDKLEVGGPATDVAVTPVGNITSTDVQNALVELDGEISLTVKKTSDIGSAILPTGTTAERDAVPQEGWTRFNSSLGKTETYDGTRWITGGGATGGGVDDVFYENATTVTTNYTITTGKNAMSAGPITINNGVTVTIPDGSNWSIVGSSV